MSKSNKPTKSEFMAAYEYDAKRRKTEKEFASRSTNCFKCSKANPTEIILDQNKTRQYLDDKILFVHDQKFNCDFLKSKNKSQLHNCKNGNKLAPEKCSTCIHARHQLTVEYKNLEPLKLQSPMKEMRILYKCSKHNEKGHYYRSTFSCEDYKEK